MSLPGKILIPLEKWIRNQQFQPSLLGIFVNSSYILRKPLYKIIKRYSASLEGKILDYGCGNSPYESLFPNCEYYGIDISLKHESDHFRKFDGKTIPFENNYFDSVICTEVIEHVSDEVFLLQEIYRVMKPNGVLLMTVPFFWEEHGHPDDYRRFTADGIKSLLEKQGLNVLASNKTTRTTASIFQIISSRFYNRFSVSNFYLNTLITMVFIAPLNMFGLFCSNLFKGSRNIYLNTVILSKKDV